MAKIQKFFVIGRDYDDKFVLGCIKLHHKNHVAEFKKWKRITDVVDPKKFEKFLPVKKFTEICNLNFKIDKVQWAMTMKKFAGFKQIWIHKKYVNRTA